MADGYLRFIDDEKAMAKFLDDRAYSPKIWFV